MLHLHLFFCQYRGNFRTSTQYFRPNFCTSTHAAAPSVVYLYVAKKLLQWEHKRGIFTGYRLVIYTLFNLTKGTTMYRRMTSQLHHFWCLFLRFCLAQNQFINHFIVPMSALPNSIRFVNNVCISTLLGDMPIKFTGKNFVHLSRSIKH